MSYLVSAYLIVLITLIGYSIWIHRETKSLKQHIEKISQGDEP